MAMAGRAGPRMAVLVAALGVCAGGAPVATAATDSCPPGQVEDVTTPGFQCVQQCPAGMLIDGVTGVCVPPPGIPPPPLR